MSVASKWHDDFGCVLMKSEIPHPKSLCRFKRDFSVRNKEFSRQIYKDKDYSHCKNVNFT